MAAEGSPCDNNGPRSDTADPGQEAGESLQKRAESMYQRGKLGECLMILEAAEAHNQEEPRQKLVVQMHIAARSRDWWKVGLLCL